MTFSDHAATKDSIAYWRASVLELVLSVVVVALGINLVSNAFAGASARSQAVVGLMLVAGVIAVAARKYWTGRKEHHIEGAFLISAAGQVILPMHGYAFSGKCAGDVQAAFAENPALRAQWDVADETRRTQGWLAEHPNQAELLRELAENYAIEKLASTTGHYLRTADPDGTACVTLTRASIPASLLENRFLDLFSRPPQDRPAFGDPVDDTVVMAYRLGAYFHRFELRLPAGSTIARESGAIRIRHPLMTVEISVAPPFWALNIPPVVEEYLADGSIGRDRPYKVEMTVIVHFALRSMIARRRRANLQEWARHYVARLEDEVSLERYLDRINVDALSATVYAFNTARNRGLNKSRQAIEEDAEAKGGRAENVGDSAVARPWSRESAEANAWMIHDRRRDVSD
jgi:hypothetical protein